MKNLTKRVLVRKHLASLRQAVTEIEMKARRKCSGLLFEIHQGIENLHSIYTNIYRGSTKGLELKYAQIRRAALIAHDC